MQETLMSLTNSRINIEQYEKRLAEKDSLIAYLQKELEELKTQR